MGINIEGHVGKGQLPSGRRDIGEPPPLSGYIVPGIHGVGACRLGACHPFEESSKAGR